MKIHQLTLRHGLMILCTLMFPACTPSPEQIRNKAEQFWVGFAFENSYSDSANTEKLFAEYVDLLQNPALEREYAGRLLASVIDRSTQSSEEVSRMFVDLCEKYLYSPESPVRDDELYLHAAERMILNPFLSDYEKLRPRYQQNMARKNRVGHPATDFTGTLADGGKIRLSEVKAEYTLLFFNNPNCVDCRRLAAGVKGNALCQKLQSAGRMKVFSLFIDPDEQVDLWRAHLKDYPSEWIAAYDKGAVLYYRELYDLRLLPSLYLLDRKKRVLVKGTSDLKKVLDYLERTAR